MQAAIEEGDGVQLELLQVGQVQELGHELTDAILLLVGGSVRQHVNVPEQQPAQVVHPAQVQHEPAQRGQLPGSVHLQVLDRVQLHQLQDTPDALHGHGEDPQLLAAQVHQAPPLFGLLQQVAEDLVKGILLEAQVIQHLHRGPRQLQPRLRLSPAPLLHGRGWFGLQQRANAGRDAGPRGPEVLVGVLAQVQHLKLPPPAGPCVTC